MRLSMLGTAVVLVAVGAAACSPRLPQGSAGTASVFSDPFAYCAAVGTVDAPDARYSGSAIPDAVINGFKKAAGLDNSTEPMDMLRKTTIWRCMAGKVYACNFGANLPCDSKADTNSTPSPAMADYCRANADADSIPMSVTGHATVYNWRCVKETPEAGAQAIGVDPAGYPANVWYAIEPAP
jgi:hypothetical protein